MIKKVFVGVLLAAAFGFLVFGAVNRTMAKSLDNEPLALNQSVSAGYGGGNGNGNSQTYQNQVVDGGVDGCIADGEGYGVGNGAGAGYAAGNVQPPLDGTGYGYGNTYEGSEVGMGGQPENAPADGTRTGIADVDEWLTYDATVDSVSTYLWGVTFEDGSTLDIDGRTLSYLVELGFSVNPGDSLVVTGFYEDGLFEVGQVENLTTGESAVIRTDSGTPLWSGGQNGGQNSGRGGRNH